MESSADVFRKTIIIVFSTNEFPWERRTLLLSESTGRVKCGEWMKTGRDGIAKSLSFHVTADYELYFHRLLLCEVDIAKYDEEWMEKLIG